MRDGHDAAFTELYLRHRGVARRVAATYRYRGDPDDLVNEAFEKVFAALRRGSGPTGSFRAYLLVTLRRLAGERTDRAAEQPYDDLPEPVAAAARGPALAAEERQLINRAFESLPDRSQAVLWYTAVEGRHPRELSTSFGMSPNAVSALAYRAREQLRQAYLQAHLQTLSRPQCEPHRSGLGAYVRDGQSQRDRLKTEQHVEHCPSCQGLVAELHEVNRLLVRALVPVFLAAPAKPIAAALAGAAGSASADGARHAMGGGSAASGRGTEAALSGGDAVRRLPTALGWAKGAASAAGSVAAAAALLGGLAVTGTLLYRERAQEVDVVPAAAPSASAPATTATTTAAPATGAAAPRTAATPAVQPCQAESADQASAQATSSATTATTATTTPTTTQPPRSTTGLSLRLPLVPDVALPALLDPQIPATPVLTLEDPVCDLHPEDDHGELTVAVAGVGIGTTTVPQTTATTAAPLIDVAAAGVELTIELSEGALAVDAELPAGCELLEGGHTVRCTVDEALLGDGTTLGLELLSEHEIATVTLRQGDQTIDVRAVELLQDLTGSLLPPLPSTTPPSPTQQRSSPPSPTSTTPLIPGLSSLTP